MVFYNFCYYIWGQHCCWTEQAYWWIIFCFFRKFAFPSTLLLPSCVKAVPTTTCILFNSTYKLSISTDMIVDIHVTKLLTKRLTESHRCSIFSRWKYLTDTWFKSYQSFDKVIDKFAAAKARKLWLLSYVIASKALDRSIPFIFC